MTLRVDGNEDLLALPPLYTTSYIDKGEASIIANREDVSWDGIRNIQKPSLLTRQPFPLTPLRIQPYLLVRAQNTLNMLVHHRTPYLALRISPRLVGHVVKSLCFCGVNVCMCRNDSSSVIAGYPTSTDAGSPPTEDKTTMVPRIIQKSL